MAAKRLLILTMVLVLCGMFFPAPPARADGELTLTVTHNLSGALISEILNAVIAGTGRAADYGKLKVVLHDNITLTGNYTGGDWGTLYTLPGLLPAVTGLELEFATGIYGIPNYAMSDNTTSLTWLRSLTLSTPGTGVLAQIGAHAFSWCTALGGTLTIPYTVTSIGEYAFYLDQTLTGLDLSQAVILDAIGNNAFSLCSKIENTIMIPGSVTVIGSDAFSQDTNLAGLDLTQATKLAVIGSNAFNACAWLSGPLFIPGSVVSIGMSAFYNCSRLLSLDLSQASALRSIGSQAFKGCSGLEGRLVIPAAVRIIGEQAFQVCTGLSGLTISSNGDDLEIGSRAFFYCSGLIGTVVIPDRVKTLTGDTFNGCVSLDAVVLRNAGSAPASSSLFTDQPQITAYYPAVAQASYLAMAGLPAKRAAYDDLTARFTHFWLAGLRGAIDEASKTVLMDLPDGTDLTSLTPDMYAIGASISPTGAQDFSARLKTYTVSPIQGLPVDYAVKLYSRPGVSGSVALAGICGQVGDKTVTAALSGSCPEEISFTAETGGKTATAKKTGDGDITFDFAAADLNALAQGSYDILVSGAATQANAAIAQTKVGTLTVGLADDAGLSGLSLSSGTLTPAFSGSVTEYTATVGAAVDSVSVTATANDPNATVGVNSTGKSAMAKKGVYGPFALAVGENEITVLVTAQDGVTQKTYTVTVTREEAETPDTGDQGPWAWIALIGLAGVELWIAGRRKQGKAGA